MSGRTLRDPIPWRQVPLFQALQPQELSRLAATAVLREYARGERVFGEGEPSENLYFVITGRVKVSKARPDGKDLILDLPGPGDPLGVIAALEGFPFPASARAQEDARVLSLPRRDFLAFLSSHPEAVRGLLVGLSLRQVELARRLAEFPGSVEYRIARLFLALAGRMGRREENRVFVPLALSRQEIADLAGTTLESAIRVLSRWGKENLVLTGPDGFTIPDLDSLEARAEAESGK